MERFDFTVSDLCLLALAVITNRPGLAPAKHDVDGTYLVSGVAERPEIARIVAAMWDDTEASVEEQLLARLLVDFRLRGTGTTPMQWGAALRIAEYAPALAGIVAARVSGLQVTGDAGGRAAANGCDVAQYVAGLAPSRSVDVQIALLDLSRATDDLRVANACVEVPGYGPFADLGRPILDREDVVREQTRRIAALVADGAKPLR